MDLRGLSDETIVALVQNRAAAERQAERVRAIERAISPGGRALLRRLDAAAGYFHRLNLRTHGVWAKRDRLGAVSEAARRAAVAVHDLREVCWRVAVESRGRDAVEDERGEAGGFCDGDGI